jgi:hypothetical protein
MAKKQRMQIKAEIKAEIKEESEEGRKGKEVIKASHVAGHVYMGLVDEKATADESTPEEVLQGAIRRAYKARFCDEVKSLKIADPTDQETIISTVEHMCKETKVTRFRREALRAVLQTQAAMNAEGAPESRLWPSGDFLCINLNTTTGTLHGHYSSQ